MVDRGQELANLPLSQRGSIIFLRALLAVLFMNLVLIASELFCMTGTMLISAFFLTGYFIPLCARKFMELRERRKLQKQSGDDQPITDTNRNS